MLPIIAVLTCQRRDGVSYLARTIEQIDAEGGAECNRLVLVDGHIEGLRVPSGWFVASLGQRVGSSAALRAMLFSLQAFRRDVLAFEDDVQLCRNAVQRMCAVEVPPDCGCVSFFDMKELARPATIGMYRRSPSSTDIGFFGNQCLRFHADMVRWLVARDWQSTRFGAAPNSGDRVIGELVAMHPTRKAIGIHCPCLVEHVGEQSACAPANSLTRSRRATNFPGVDFDALTLPAFEVTP